MAVPQKLQSIVLLFESLSEDERRESLAGYARSVAQHGPRPGERFDLEDVRQDEGCADTVGIFLRVDRGGRTHFRVTFGPQVQTLTKAMATILCRGLDGCALEEVTALPEEIIPRIVGGPLMRMRSQTVFYMLRRMKSACHIAADRAAADRR